MNFNYLSRMDCMRFPNQDMKIKSSVTFFLGVNFNFKKIYICTEFCFLHLKELFQVLNLNPSKYTLVLYTLCTVGDLKTNEKVWYHLSTAFVLELLTSKRTLNSIMFLMLVFR